MKPLQEEREARSPLEEGLSLMPYVPIYQRMHARRWRSGLLAALAGLGLAWWWRGR